MEALAGEYIRNYLHVKRFPCIGLVCKLVPVQYREYEYGLFDHTLRKANGISRWASVVSYKNQKFELSGQILMKGNEN